MKHGKPTVVILLSCYFMANFHTGSLQGVGETENQRIFFGIFPQNFNIHPGNCPAAVTCSVFSYRCIDDSDCTEDNKCCQATNLSRKCCQVAQAQTGTVSSSTGDPSATDTSSSTTITTVTASSPDSSTGGTVATTGITGATSQSTTESTSSAPTPG